MPKILEMVPEEEVVWEEECSKCTDCGFIDCRPPDEEGCPRDNCKGVMEVTVMAFKETMPGFLEVLCDCGKTIFCVTKPVSCDCGMLYNPDGTIVFQPLGDNNEVIL